MMPIMSIYGKSEKSSFWFHTTKQTLQGALMSTANYLWKIWKKFPDHLSVHESELHNFQIDKKLFLGSKGARIKDDHYLDQEKEA